MNENLARGVMRAMRHRRRFQGIALQECPAGLLQVLIRPFPELKSLKISPEDYILGLPSTFLSGFTPSLRRLSLQVVVLDYLSPLLSSTINLVELTLTLNRCDSAPGALLIANLQRMSCLRRLELKWRYGARGDETPQAHPLPPASAGEVVSLPELTDLIFYGPVKFLEMLVVALAMPSLQRLDAEIWPGSLAFTGVKHLFKFICDTQSQFIAVCIGSLQSTLEFSAETSPKFDHVQTLKITFSRLVPRDFAWVQIIGNVLSEHLSTVEELIVEWHEGSLNWLNRIQSQWVGFFNHCRRVKKVQVPSELAHSVAHSLEQGGPLFLYNLEQVKVQMKHPPQIGPSGDHQYEYIRDKFKPLMAARQQVGRPVILSFFGGMSQVGGTA